MPFKIAGDSISEAPAGAGGLESADFFGCGGFFETLRVHRRRIGLFDGHWQRLSGSLERWGWAPPASRESVLAAIRREVLLWPPEAGLRLRIVVAPRPDASAGSDGRAPTAAVLGAHALPHGLLLPAPEREPVRLSVFRDFRVNSEFPLAGMKSLQRQAYWEARRRVRLAGADDAILLNELGEVVETSTSNLFWVADGELFWPDPATGALPGVFGEWLARKAASVGLRVNRVRTGPEALGRAEGAISTNSVAEALRVGAIDGRSLESEKKSDIVDALLRLVEESRREIENVEVAE